MSESRSTPDRTVGVRDVAALAGVSRQTVSRVLNDHPDVAAATQQRVRSAMAELGYRMNNAARALGTRRSRTLGVLASDALQYGPSRSIAALEAAARGSGYWVSAAFADAGDAEAVVSAVDHLIAQGVEGIVVVAPHARTLHALDALRIGVPVVTLHSAGQGARGLSVDQAAGARLAVAALADAGHTRIAHLAGPPDWLEAESRAEGFAAELAARGLPAGPVIVGDWSAGSGYAAASDIRTAGVTAVFAANDQMALGLLGGLQEAGLSVPADLSVVGFDDIPDAAYYWPKLTTVRQDFDELARRAIDAVVGGVAPAGSGPTVPGSAASALAPVAPVLISRASVAPPR
ncbi:MULTISPECIES: LacI family DNA-binding transcriptional regulator [unclassified Microbacterium]|uniref:LacI family DNA-binding transcriptional regulator n=1 Tax=unclassified Microbacterium TaxID=2609290 RepID=UPI000EA8EE6F|nr:MULTISPECIES: LacI family DNA-binding transcriptional regulator [unclassified Microbacterium]MBT2483648.1 LacI family DNA-binding transcriptional regulator [Microbacterium sp. ISL-108]RKN66650.1 LacI family DNA-binding transcriptional regulator [Microbacterium sp. CGR2]